MTLSRQKGCPPVLLSWCRCCRCVKKVCPPVLVLLQWHQQVTGVRAFSAVVWILWCWGSRREGKSFLCVLCSSALGRRWEEGSALVLLLHWQGGEQLYSGTGNAQFIHKPHCNSTRILNRSSLLCCCLLGNFEKGGNFPPVHVTGLNGPLYCWNSVAPLARQAGDTYFLGNISQTSFILGYRMSALIENLVCFQGLKRCVLLLHNKATAFIGLHSTQTSQNQNSWGWKGP